MAKKTKLEDQPAILLESANEIEAAGKLRLQIYATNNGFKVKFSGNDATRRRDSSLDRLSQVVGVLENEVQNLPLTFWTDQDEDLF